MFAHGAASITAVPVGAVPPVSSTAATATTATAAMPATTHFIGAGTRRLRAPGAACGTAGAVTVGAGSVAVGAETATGVTDAVGTGAVSGRSAEAGGSP